MTSTYLNSQSLSLNHNQVLNMLDLAEKINVKSSFQISGLKEHILMQLEHQKLDKKLVQRVNSLKTSILNQSNSFPSREPLVNLTNKILEPLIKKKVKGSAQQLFQQALSFHARKEFKKAFEKYQIAASKGHTEATNNLAVFYQIGIGTKKNPELALKLFHEAAATGHPDASFNIGLLHQNKQNPSHYRLAAHWYGKSTQNSRTLYHLAQMYFKGLGVFQDKETGLKFLQEAALKGHGEARSGFSREELGQLYYQKAQKFEEKSELENAFKCLIQAKEFKNPEACCRVGQYYLMGLYVQKNLAKAAEHFKEASNMGCEEAFYQLGCLYDEGLGVEKNESAALDLFLKAPNHTEALFQAGLLYLDGCKGIEKDNEKAIKFFIKAAEEGNEEALQLLVDNFEQLSPQQKESLAPIFFEKGKRLSEDEGNSSVVEAFRWFQKAASLNYLSAVHQIGVCHLYGLGTPINEKEGFAILEFCAEKGHEGSIFNLGNCYELAQDFLKAAEYYARLPDHKGALFHLAHFYMEGQGVDKNIHKAVELLIQAASMGLNKAFEELELISKNHLEVNASLAQLYFDEGISCQENENEDHAFSWFVKAKNLGHLDALNQLGICYELGKGTLKNSKMAFECFQEAASKEHSEGSFNLGRCFQYGIGVKRNIEEAKICYEKSPEHFKSLTALAQLFLEEEKRSEKKIQSRGLLKRPADQDLNSANSKFLKDA